MNQDTKDRINRVMDMMFEVDAKVDVVEITHVGPGVSEVKIEFIIEDKEEEKHDE